PGSSCPKKYVALNKEYSEAGMCTASREYQHLKIKELEQRDLTAEAYAAAYEKIVGKSCACVGLGTSALLKYGLDTRTEGSGVSVCPGPNMAYFSKIASLKEMVGHIYGESNLIERTDRPNMFIKELNIYIEYLGKRFEEAKASLALKQMDALSTFAGNLNEGISYYQSLFQGTAKAFGEHRAQLLGELSRARAQVDQIGRQILGLRGLWEAKP